MRDVVVQELPPLHEQQRPVPAGDVDVGDEGGAHGPGGRERPRRELALTASRSGNAYEKENFVFIKLLFNFPAHFHYKYRALTLKFPEEKHRKLPHDRPLLPLRFS